jgi:hypothetical protein
VAEVENEEKAEEEGAVVGLDDWMGEGEDAGLVLDPLDDDDEDDSFDAILISAGFGCKGS